MAENNKNEDIKNKPPKRKKRVITPPNEIPEQDPNERIKNFNEVKLGYTEELALNEAGRCLLCPRPGCVEGCPLHNKIPEFIKMVREKKYIEAATFVKEINYFPAITSRVCPHEDQCEGHCLLKKKFGSVTVGGIERFVADYLREHLDKPYEYDKQPPNGRKVAVIGSGPAGMACARKLVQYGYDVTIFESFHIGGGVLAYGIPEFRLPKKIVEYELEELKYNGVKFQYNTHVGKDITIDELKAQGYEAFFIGTGAVLPKYMKIPGEHLKGVMTSEDFLKRANMIYAYHSTDPQFQLPDFTNKKVIVIGGGNVAMDVSRTAKRLNTSDVIIVYRRAIEQAPACRAEIEEAQAEGVKFDFLRNPVEFIGDENGVLKGVRIIKMRLGEPDSSGRARPIPIEGSEYEMSCDYAILSIGNNCDTSWISKIDGVELNRWNNIVVDKETGQTAIPYIFSGGDIVTGPLTVISAIGGGQKAAEGIHKYLSGKEN